MMLVISTELWFKFASSDDDGEPEDDDEDEDEELGEEEIEEEEEEEDEDDKEEDDRPESSIKVRSLCDCLAPMTLSPNFSVICFICLCPVQFCCFFF